MSYIYKQIQHRSRLKYLNKEMQKYVKKHHPKIKDDDFVEIIETRSFEVNNHWTIGSFYLDEHYKKDGKWYDKDGNEIYPF